MLCDRGRTKQFVQNVAHTLPLTSGYGCRRGFGDVQLVRWLLVRILDCVFNI